MVRAEDGGLAQIHRLSIHGESVVQGDRAKLPVWRAEFGSVAQQGVAIEGRGFWPGYPRPEQRRSPAPDSRETV